MSKDEAVNLIKSRFSKRKIGAVGDAGSYFVIEALDPKHPGENDPYFAVDKKTGKISNYTPDDLIEFGKMMGYGVQDEEIEHGAVVKRVPARMWKW